MSDIEFRKNVIKQIEIMKRKSPTTINEGNYFTEQDVNHFISELKKIVDKNQELNCISLSLRKSSIIVIEEEISCNKIKRAEIKLENIIRKAIIEYNVYIKQRSKSKLKSIEQIHPEKPCVQYQDSKRSMGEYLKSLKFILANQQILIKHLEVSQGLENAKKKVIDCD